MVAQLVEDFIHLERGEDGFDEHGGADGAVRQADFFLRADENIVPEARFEVALHLGQIEIGAAAARQQFLRVVVEVEAEIEEWSRTSALRPRAMALVQMPSARADEEHGGLVVELVLFAVAGSE